MATRPDINVKDKVRVARRLGVKPDGSWHEVACVYCGVAGRMSWHPPGTVPRYEWDGPFAHTRRVMGYYPMPIVSCSLEFDHRKPISRGGSNTSRNLVLACQTCNVSKGARTLPEWVAVLRRKSRHPRAHLVLARIGDL